MAKMNFKDALNKSLQATKKYVDDQIIENKFSGDYNDLNNRPCYEDEGDIPEYLNIEIYSDTDFSDKENVEVLNGTTSNGNYIYRKYVKLFSDITIDMINTMKEYGVFKTEYEGQLTEVPLIDMLDESQADQGMYFIGREFEFILQAPEGYYLPENGLWYEESYVERDLNGNFIAEYKTVDDFNGILLIKDNGELNTGTIKQLDEKFIPDTIARIEDVNKLIDENGFSGDYNDLENRPCYDERVIETFNSTEDFNGDITGKVVIEEVSSASTEEVSSASTEEVTTKGSFIPKYVKMGDIAPVFNNLASNIENGNVKATCTVRYEHIDSTKVDTSELDILDEDCVILSDSTWSDRVYFVYNEITLYAGTVLSPGIWYVYLDDGEGTVIYPISYSIELADGDFKKLDYKYIDYMPGKNVEGEMFTVYENLNDMYEETNGKQEAAQTGAEIFNDKENVATGQYSHAEGSGTKAYGSMSHAEGIGSAAFDLGDHAEGYYTYAIGGGSHSEGRSTVAEGMWSHAENYSAYAKGWGSHAEGNSTIASGEAQHVQGKFNIEDTENKYAHIVGNGQYDKNRSNAHTLDWNGNAWFAGNVTCNSILMTDQTTGLVYRMYIDDGELKTALMTDDN